MSTYFKKAKQTPMKRILVVDDTPEFLRDISLHLQPEFLVATCSSPSRVEQRLARNQYDVLITSLLMKEMDGFEVIRRVRGRGWNLPVIMVTSFGSENTWIEAFRLGAADYIKRPVQGAEIRARVRRALSEAGQTASEAGKPRIITGNAEMRELLIRCTIAAKTDARVLILGETGTGKELLAQLIHGESSRADQAFIEINCAAIPQQLVESEFFGHEKGSFTSAGARRIGRFEEVGAGTLFLDEVGELDISLQSKLLRVLQSGEFNRVGGAEKLTCQARILAATNRKLADEVTAGRFRADLYYRLNVVTLELPPLRERPEDIPLLLNYFTEKMKRKNEPPVTFSEEALEVLTAYSWPGNVRELEHLVEQLTIFEPGKHISPQQLPPGVHLRSELIPSSANRDYHTALRLFEKEYFRNALRRSKGSFAEAARLAGMDRSQFFRKAVAIGIHDPKHKGNSK
jgi:DNA-binding NtrC family response regulator